MTRVAVILTGLALSLFAASPAAAARTEFFGISQSTNRLDDQDLQGMAAARIRTERFPLRWPSVQPSQGSFDWVKTDAFVGALASHGLRPVPFVWGSPSWVAGSMAHPPIDSAADEQAWQNFLKAAVARYGPGGSYWGTPYHQQYGAGATPLPIQSWQVWNEPNLPKSFAPSPSADRYARLLQISHDAIKSQDPQAQIVLAGLVGYGNTKSWTFLGDLYRVAGVKSNFDVAALHPYSPSLAYFRDVIQHFHQVMMQHGDAGKPLWLTEVGWGSAPPDHFGINKGLAGQQRMLVSAYKLILSSRTAWNVQRVFWFYWRDPSTHPPGTCSFCDSAGLLTYKRAAKPAYNTFKGFTAETTPPQASITSGPSQGGFTKDSTPTLTFASNEASSTFECRVDAGSFTTCSSPFVLPLLSDGAHDFFVKAIDAPGNESQVRSRSFTVDTTDPGVTISSGPADGSTSSDRNPSFSFASNESGASFSCQVDSSGFAPCSSPYAASQLANGQHSFQVRATDEAGNVGSAARTWRIGLVITSGPASGSPTNDPTPRFAFSSPDPGGISCRVDGAVVDPNCNSPFESPALSDGDHTFTVEQGTDTASRDFAVDTTAAAVTMSSGPANGSATNDPTPTFEFSSPESGSTFQCRYEGDGFSACSGASSDTPASPLSDGPHSFFVRAIDAAHNASGVLSRSFTVDTVAPQVKIRGPGRTTTTRRKRQARDTFILKASEHVQLRCRIDSRPFKSCSSPYRTPRLRRGTHILKVKATDRAGNVGTKRKRFKIARRGLVPRTVPGAPSRARCHGVTATLIGSGRSDQLRGTKGRDVIVGGGGNDKINGHGGRDLICARTGEDEVTGGRGADWILGGPGSDDLWGGPGRDTIRGGLAFDYCGSAPRHRTFHCQAHTRPPPP